jgi:hypothetical protein
MPSSQEFERLTSCSAGVRYIVDPAVQRSEKALHYNPLDASSLDLKTTLLL